MTYGLTSAGYTPRRASDWLDLIFDDYNEWLDSQGLPQITEDDMARDHLIGGFRAILAIRLGEIDQVMQENYNSRDPNNATGIQLDSLANVSGVTRLPATYGAVSVDLTGDANADIPAGIKLRRSDANDEPTWSLTEDVTLDGGGSYSDAPFRCDERGEFEAPAGMMTRITTPFEGLDSATNAADGTPGEAQETDASLRTRMAAAKAGGGSGTVAAIRAHLLELDYLDAAVVVENDTGAAAIIEGLTLDAHSIGVVVYPAPSTNGREEEVAQYIYERKPAGIPTDTTGVPDVTVEVTSSDGFTVTIIYDIATTTTVNVATTVVLDTGYVIGDVSTAVQEIISGHFDDLNVGDPVRILHLLALVRTVVGVTGATILLNGGAADVDPDATSIAVIGTNTVST